MQTTTVAALSLLAVAVLYALRQQGQEYNAGEWGETSNEEGASIVDEITEMARVTFNAWEPPAKYAGLIEQAEQRHGIPRLMLARLLYQESRWRNDIISGRLRSPAGALGIAQFMPATAREMNIDPLNPAQAIDAAGRYLASLYRRFGNWTAALAAYNWGQGNVARRGLGAAPTETRNYFGQILGDLNAATGESYA